MKSLFTTLIAAVFAFCAHAQSSQKFNLDLEEQGATATLSQDWLKWGSYAVGIDTVTVFSGNTSAWIASGETGGSFGSVAYAIPANFEGEEIQLEGFMKLKEVENGFAGLMLRIDGSAETLAFDNMQNQSIKGTKDWEKYVITLPYPEGAETIYVAGLLSGNGKAWFDGFKLSIDGKDVQTLGGKEKTVFQANLDNEFDAGSKVIFPELNDKMVEDLALLGRVWGFLKYHHPQVGQGNCNWDYELFRVLPEYMNAKTTSERDEVLVNWIEGVGEVPECTECGETSKTVFKKPDHSWMESDQIGSRLQEKLKHIYDNRYQGPHFYIGFAPGVGNPVFKNEEAYADMPYPDEGFRLLSLYKYWNMIEYFFPNKHLTDKDWNSILEEYIPQFIHAENELEYEMAAVKVIEEIQDSHANLWGGGDRINEWKGNYYAPVHLRFIENQLVVDDYFNPELKPEAGLEIGDVITHINGEAVEDMVERLQGYYPASNHPTRLRDISADLLRSQKKEIGIKFISENGKQQKNLKLYERDSLDMYGWYRRNDAEDSFKMLENNIGYVTLGSIKDQDISQIKEQFKNTDGIIIDIRNYPSTFVPFSLGSWFTSSETPFVRFSTGSMENPGEFTMTPPLTIPASPEAYKGKLVVLVNEISQSQAEYTAMAFRAGDNTTIVGSTTAGADGNVSTILLPGGLRTMISGIGVYYPDGTETQRVGIVPDVEVNPTIEGIRSGRDELLEEAVEIIKKERQ